MFVTDAEWLQNGERKKLLARVLIRPMTGTELLVAMRPKFPCLLLHDVRFMLKQMEKRQLVYCLTPRENKGRLYFFTPKGVNFFQEHLSIQVPALPPLVNWHKYAQLTRAEVRRLVLLEMGKPGREKEPRTVSMIRKHLSEKRSITLNATSRAVRELEQMNLVRRAGVAEEKGRPLYLSTIVGRRIIEQVRAVSAGMPETGVENLTVQSSQQSMIDYIA